MSSCKGKIGHATLLPAKTRNCGSTDQCLRAAHRTHLSNCALYFVTLHTEWNMFGSRQVINTGKESHSKWWPKCLVDMGEHISPEDACAVHWGVQQRSSLLLLLATILPTAPSWTQTADSPSCLLPRRVSPGEAHSVTLCCLRAWNRDAVQRNHEPGYEKTDHRTSWYTGTLGSSGRDLAPAFLKSSVIFSIPSSGNFTLRRYLSSPSPASNEGQKVRNSIFTTIQTLLLDTTDAILGGTEEKQKQLWCGGIERSQK